MTDRGTFLASLAAAAAIGGRRSSALAGGAVLPADAQRHDLDELWNTLLAVGVAPFAAADRRSVVERYLETRAALRTPLDSGAFLLRIAPVFGALNDGHVGLRGGGISGALTIPIRCTVAGGETIVLASDRGVVEPGSRLVSIAGVAAYRIRDATLAGWGGQTERLRVERFASACRIVTTILAGDLPAYDVRWVTPGGVQRRAMLPRSEVALPWARADRAPYAFRTAGDGTIGVIDYRQCSGATRFAAFLRDTFAFVRARRIRGIVVDIRNNTGGDSDLNNELWRYLTSKTFTQFGPVLMRSSELLKQLYGKEKYVEIYGVETWDAPNGTLVTYSKEKIGYVTPGPNPLRFDGPVALLIGPRTFSSALDCAIAAKDYGLATIVGEETSEPTHTTGELFEMSTRYAGIVGSFTTKFFSPPKPAPPKRGVVPDIDVKTTLEDEIAGRDPVLERALREVRRIAH